MGWPLAVSAGLMERSSRALVAALWPLTVGHLLAMLVVILPFSLLVALVQWQRQIRIGAGLLVIGFGIFRFVSRRHPRVLARIPPTQLVLCFRNNRPMVSGCTVDFITPGVDDRLAVDVVDEGHQAVLEFMLGSDADMAQ